MEDVTFLFGGWWAVLRVLFIGVTGYLTLLVLLRISGQRTLAQLSPLDFVITVTIGSAFGRVLTATEVGLAEVAAAFLTLIGLQYAVAYVWRSTPRLRAAATTDPALLYYDGQVVEAQMRRTRLRREDLLAAARQQGAGDLDEVKAILLESNGSLAVVTASQYGEGRAVQAVVEGSYGRPDELDDS